MNWEDRLAQVVGGLLVFGMLVLLGYYGAQAFISETEQRIEHNRIHMREMGRAK